MNEFVLNASSLKTQKKNIKGANVKYKCEHWNEDKIEGGLMRMMVMMAHREACRVFTPISQEGRPMDQGDQAHALNQPGG